MPCSAHQSTKGCGVNSGPLSTRTAVGRPCAATRSLSTLRHGGWAATADRNFHAVAIPFIEHGQAADAAPVVQRTHEDDARRER